MIIIVLFLIGFVLGLGYAFIGERLPLLVPEIIPKEENSWIFNLFMGVVNALVFLISYYYFGISYEFFASLIISGLVLIIFISDFKYMIILDSPLVISSILIIILKIIYRGFNETLISVISGIALFFVMLLIFDIGKLIFKKETLGGGDIKLAFVMGLTLNFYLGLVAIVLSTFLALPYAIASLEIKKSNAFPYGPFLCGALFLVFFHYDKFINLLNFLF